MSFATYKDVIEEGDVAILYLNPNTMHAIKVCTTLVDKLGKVVDNVFQTTFGALKVKDLIGIKFGTKVSLSRGWAYILHPTPELWTLTLPHRTQIIYTPDISMIILQLDIRPGSIVVESGTGSGSLTHALARSVRPDGIIHTFDFHEQRVTIAKEEFDAHGLSSVIKVQHRDVCHDGFGDKLDKCADAVFLDLPHPWLVVSHAVRAFKNSGGRFCSFSPCIEQVQKTCCSLRDEGFTEIQTLECLRRESSVQFRTLPVASLNKDDPEKPPSQQFSCCVLPASQPGHTGYLTFASLPPTWARFSQPQETDEAEPE